MTLDRSLDISGEFSVDGRRRVLGQQRDAFRDGSARRDWCMDHRHGQMATLDHDLRTRAHPRQESCEIAGSFRFRDSNHMISHAAIIPSFLPLETELENLGSRRQFDEDTVPARMQKYESVDSSNVQRALRVQAQNQYRQAQRLLVESLGLGSYPSAKRVERGLELRTRKRCRRSDSGDLLELPSELGVGTANFTS